MAARDDLELMQHADGELADSEAPPSADRLERDAEARAKVASLSQLGEVVRGHLELSADDVPQRRFDAMWRTISRETADASRSRGIWGAISDWLDRHRGHVITGAVSAAAVAAIAIVLRPPPASSTMARSSGPIDVRPAAMRTAPEIDSLDTPDGEGSVINIQDEDGNTTVIWVSPADTVEGI